MDLDRRAFFRDMEALFQSNGWKHLTDGWRAEFDSLPLQSFLGAKSFTDVQADRVRYRLLAELLSLADELERQKAEIEAADSDEGNPYE